MRSPILLIALHEFTLNRRNRWVGSFALIFALLTLLIAYFGMVTSGYAGFQDFTRTSASLINLCGFLIPLFALLLGVFSFISDREYTELLITQPISRTQLLLGKYVGLVLTLFSSTLIGFGLPGVIFSLVIGGEGAAQYTVVVGLSLLSGVVFTGVAILITLLTNRQQVALGIALGVWLFFEIFYGLIILGSTLYLSHGTLKTLLIVTLYGNPIDLTRVLSLLAIGGPHFFGPAGATLMKMTGSVTLSFLYGMAGILVWIVVPMLLSIKAFRKQNL